MNFVSGFTVFNGVFFNFLGPVAFFVFFVAISTSIGFSRR